MILTGRFHIALAVLLCHCSGLAGPEPAHAAGQPQIACRAPVHDFGAMDNRLSVTNAFVLENRGTAPLRISGVRACCGSSARLSSMVVPPGSNSVLEVRLSLHRRKGRQIKTVYVMSDDPVRPRYRIQLKGTAVAALDAHPGFLNFGRTSSDYAGSKDANVFTANGRPFRITNVVSTVARFAVEVAETGTNTSRITVRTVPPLPPGLTRGVIRVMTDFQDGRRAEIPTVVTVAGSLMTVPREIVLTGTRGVTQWFHRYVIVRARDSGSFKIVGTELPNSDMKIDITPLSDRSYKCRISNIAPAPGMNGKKIVLLTDREGAERLEIPIRVVLQAPPPLLSEVE